MIRKPTVTVFGGTGFLGHAIVQLLAEDGYLIRIPTRDVEKANDMRLMGQTGQITPFFVNMRSEKAIAEALAGSDIVINLIGILAESKGNNFQQVHVETAARLARIAKAEGVQKFVHVSALGADAHSLSRYARTKAMGEDAVRAFFPDSIVLRPSIMFGPRDNFFNRFALMARYSPFLPLMGGGQTKFQPVYVGDVAHFLALALTRPDTAGQGFALGGPYVYSFKELMELLLETMNLKRALVSVPWKVAQTAALFLEKLPNPLLTRDQIELLRADNTLGPDTNHLGDFASLGLLPLSLEDVLPAYVEKGFLASI